MIEFTDGSEKLLRFKGKLTIFKCVALKRDLMTIVEGCPSPAGEWKFDFEVVEALDVAALQLLLALVREIEHRGGKTVLAKDCAPLKECMNSFNLKVFS